MRPQLSRHLVLAVALTGALAVTATGSAAPRSADRASAGVFKVIYATPKTSDEAFLIKLIKASQLSSVASSLSKALILPKNVTIAVTRSQDGPYYDPSTRTVNFNLPFAALMFEVIRTEYPKMKPYDFGVAFASLEYFVLFHEIGHSLVDLWNIPVLGREEDAVDAFSTIFMTKFVEDGDIALWGADFFNAVSTGKKYGDVDFADEHSLDQQRVYSIVCWVYGSNEKKYSYLEDILPESRLVRCHNEYNSLLKSWLQFLKPHVR